MSGVNVWDHRRWIKEETGVQLRAAGQEYFEKYREGFLLMTCSYQVGERICLWKIKNFYSFSSCRSYQEHIFYYLHETLFNIKIMLVNQDL